MISGPAQSRRGPCGQSLYQRRVR